MAITCYRGAGDKVGAPVVCNMLSEGALVTYGTHLLNQQAHAKSTIQAGVAYRSDIQLGTLVKVADPSQAKAFMAKVTGISFSLAHGSATQSLTLEKPL